jgi:hypothetical protein
MSEFNNIKWVPSWKISEEAKAAKKQQMEDERLKGLEKTENNFPALAPASTNLRVWGGVKKFSDLAKEWNTDAQQKLEKEKQMADFEKTTAGTNHFVMPTFNNSHRFVETTDFVEPDETEPLNIPADSVWKVVDYSKNRRRKEKNIEEIANRPPTPEEDGTVWPEKDLNETCWDERR